MSRFALKFLLVALALLAGCRGHDAEPINLSDEAISFATIQSDVIESSCVSCHSDSNPSGGFNFSSYKNVMDSGAVVVGKPEYSSLYLSAANGRMPPGKPLDYAHVRAIKTWIQNGAKEFAPPKISDWGPKDGAAGVEVPITVTGQGFSKDTRVVFGSRFEAKEVRFKSSGQIVATAILPSGTYDLTVVNVDGGKDTKAKAYHSGTGSAGGLEVTSLFPASGGNGTAIELSGRGFESTSRVFVGDLECASPTVQVPDKITCIVPLVDLSQRTDVIVVNSDSTQYRFASGFTYTIAASYTQIKAQIFDAKCGSCHRTGNTQGNFNLQNGTYTSIMQSGNVTAFDVDNSQVYQYVLPSHSPQEPRGQAALTPAEITLIRNWIYNGAFNDSPPTLTLPNTITTRAIGSILGGTAITVNGAGFMDGVTVNLGDVACTPTTVNPAGTTIGCVTAPHAAGAVALTVINPTVAGTTQQPAVKNNAYTYAVDPQITGISPNSVASSNTAPVTITGTNFEVGANKVTFRFGPTATVTGTAACNVTTGVCTASVIPPANPPERYMVRVTNVTSAQFGDFDGFSYSVGTPPTITSVAVESIPATTPTVTVLANAIIYTGETPFVTINGTGFLNGTALAVNVGDKAAQNGTIQYISATRIRVRAANDISAGSQSVAVTNPDGLGFTLANAIDVRTTPTITTTSPANLSISGSGLRTVTLTGTGFVDGSAVSVDSVSCPTVQFNSATEYVCGAPTLTATKQNAQVRITLPADLNGRVLTAQRSGLNLVPAIGTLSPSSSALAGGYTVTIPGDGFAGSTVTIGGVACTSPTVTTTEITCTAGTGTAGSKSVVVTNSNGTIGTKVGGFTYTP